MRRFYKRTRLHLISSNYARGVISLLLIKRLIAGVFMLSFGIVVVLIASLMLIIRFFLGVFP
ncbi:hypothetical protein D9M71_181090 [compost metagenome]